ncbi:MAG: hypothetical protein J0L87_10155 [Bacteroidetes bacterium]|nr:hypothetical protein [Bacteroidota bacterium]
MKKIIAIFLLFIFLFNSIGYYAVFKFSEYQIKKTAKRAVFANLDDSQYEIITINKNDLDKIEFKDDGKEIIYKDQLYDIGKKTETETEIVLYCINDKDEEALISSLKTHIDNHIAFFKTKKSSSGQKKNSDSSSLKIYLKNKQDSNVFHENTEQSYSKQKNIIYISALKEISTPPPESGC